MVDALDQLNVRYHIGGSLASSTYGTPRATADVDLVAELDFEQIDSFVRQLQDGYYVDRAAVEEAVRLRRSFNLIHFDTMIKVDVFIPESLGFDQQELNRARPQPLDAAEQARTFFVKSPEDLILRKLTSYRAGGRDLRATVERRARRAEGPI